MARNALGLAAVLLLVLPLSPLPARAEGEARPIAFQAAVDPPAVPLGAPFLVQLEVRHEATEQYALPGKLALGEAVLRGTPTTERTETGGTAITRFTIEATIFEALGDVELPPIVLSVTGGAGATLTVPIPPVKIEETSSDTELDDIRPLTPVLERDPTKIALTGAAVLAAFALGLVAAWLWKQRGRLTKQAPVVPADERALTALGALRAEKLVSAGRAREHYFRLSEILRSAITELTPIDARDMTTGELREALGKRAVPGLERDTLVQWLDRGDLVRFAREEIGAHAADQDLAYAERTVRALGSAFRIEEERRKLAEESARGGKAP